MTTAITARKRHQPPSVAPLAELPTKGTITKLQAIEFIAARVRDPAETIRDAKDKVRKRIDYAIANGSLTVDASGALDVLRLSTWASGVRAYAAKLRALARVHPAASAAPSSKFGTPRGFTAPLDANELRLANRLAQDQIHALRAEVEALKREVATLKPEADRRAEVREQARLSGAKRGRNR